MPVTPRTAVYPGDEPFACGWGEAAADGEPVRVGWARGSAHVGTHVDAPWHVDAQSRRIGELPLDAFVGPCVVVDAVGASELGVELLRGVDLARAPRVLFRTQARSDPTRFLDAFPTLTPAACEALARAGVRLVGVDAPSVDAIGDALPVHRALARAGIVNLENLVLDLVAPGAYELLAAPVHWPEMDAAPVRALLRR